MILANRGGNGQNPMNPWPPTFEVKSAVRARSLKFESLNKFHLSNSPRKVRGSKQISFGPRTHTDSWDPIGAERSARCPRPLRSQSAVHIRERRVVQPRSVANKHQRRMTTTRAQRQHLLSLMLSGTYSCSSLGAFSCCAMAAASISGLSTIAGTRSSPIICILVQIRRVRCAVMQT